MAEIKAVTLKTSWVDLFPSRNKINRDRWKEWKKLCIENGDKDMVDYWTENECGGCEYQDDDWCARCNLPCTVNPILTFGENMIGMACCGLGYQNKQLKLQF